MTYKEFKEKIEELGLEVIDSEYSIRVFTRKGYYTSDVSKEETYKANISPSEIGKSLKEKVLNLCVELAKTPIKEREDKKDNLDSIIHRLEVIQANAEDVMNWTIEEIQERSWNLRSSLEDIIIDLEEHKKRESNECNVRSK